MHKKDTILLNGIAQGFTSEKTNGIRNHAQERGFNHHCEDGFRIDCKFDFW